jgi:hypothetical protein
MASQVALLLPVLAIVCLIEWMLLMSHGATYGGVLEIDVSMHHVHSYKFTICDQLVTAVITMNAVPIELWGL